MSEVGKEIGKTVQRIKWNTMASVIEKGSSFAFFSLLAYRLKPEQLGLITLMLMLGYYINMVSDTGLSSVGGREIAKKVDFGLLWYIVQYRTVALCLLMPGAIMAVYFFAPKGAVWTAVVMLLASIGTSYNFSWFYLSFDRAHFATIVNLVKALILIVGTLCFVGSEQPLLRLALVFFVAHTLYGAINLLIVSRYCKTISVGREEFRRCFHATFKSTLANFSLLLLVLVYNSADIFLLSVFSDLDSVGFYNVGAKLPRTAHEMILILGAGLFPSLARWSRDKEALGRIASRVIILFSVLTLPIILFIALYAGRITTILFSQTFQMSARVLYIMIPCVLLFFMNNIFRMIAISISSEKHALYVTSFGLILNVICNVILIPAYQEIGCAISMLISELAMVLVYSVFCWHSLSLKISILLPLGLVTSSFAVLWFLHDIIQVAPAFIVFAIISLTVLLAITYGRWIARLIAVYVFHRQEVVTHG